MEYLIFWLISTTFGSDQLSGYRWWHAVQRGFLVFQEAMRLVIFVYEVVELQSALVIS